MRTSRSLHYYVIKHKYSAAVLVNQMSRKLFFSLFEGREIGEILFVIPVVSFREKRRPNNNRKERHLRTFFSFCINKYSSAVYPVELLFTDHVDGNLCGYAPTCGSNFSYKVDRLFCDNSYLGPPVCYDLRLRR